MLAVTDQTWQSEVLESKTPVIVDFWAEWCPPCKQLTPIFAQLAKDLGSTVKCVKLDTDSNPKTATTYNVRSIPTLLFIKNGQIVATELGLKTLPALKQLATKAFALAGK